MCDKIREILELKNIKDKLRKRNKKKIQSIEKTFKKISQTFKKNVRKNKTNIATEKY